MHLFNLLIVAAAAMIPVAGWKAFSWAHARRQGGRGLLTMVGMLSFFFLSLLMALLVLLWTIFNWSRLH
jgi:hypothetical protein